MRIPIRSKLAGALAVPLVALVAVAGYEVVRADQQADEATSETALATAAVGPGSLISQLQLERNFSGVDQLGLTGSLELPVASYEEARTGTDEARASLESFVTSRGEDVAAAFDAGLAAVADLEELRADIDATPVVQKGIGNAEFANEIFDRYTAIIRVLLDDTAGVALRVDDAQLRTGVELVDLATRSYELRSLIARAIILPTLTGDASVQAQTNVARLVSAADQLDASLVARGVGPYAGLPQAAVESERVTGQDELFEQFIETATTDIIVLAGQLSSTGDTGYVAMRSQVADALQAEADRVLADASDQRVLVLLLAGGAVTLALLLTLLASRSVTRPLRSLTRQAAEMSGERLPTALQQVLDTPLGEDVMVPQVAPVKVKTRDEVADVAAALNTVQGSALDLAVEQAVLRRNIADSFVNLGRRNQNLLDRQLDLITELEREEQEPDRLEGLFRLDHLATRMRRNAESLLRLAGGEHQGGADGWSSPMSMVDVVRSALGEVEDYQRVDVRNLDPATVGGSVGTDLAHVVAELVENALAFSPPHERVEVRGRRGENGAYVLAVVDQGVGMSPEQLEVANRRLAGRESFTVAPSRYLGHYVAGHLATAHGIAVELQAAPAGGITARVEVPASALTVAPEPRPAAPVPPPMPEPMPTLARTPAWEPEPEWDAPVQTQPEPQVAPEPTRDVAPVAHTTPPETGFGGLTMTPTTAGDPTTTASGLQRRVRGAQPPDTTPFGTLGAFGEDAPAAEQGAPSSAEEVSSFLSAFSGGVERGLSEARDEEDLW